MVEVKNLTKCYGDIKAVDDISFTVDTGEVLGFLGPNGAGKSTTMNIITGYISSTVTVPEVTSRQPQEPLPLTAAKFSRIQRRPRKKSAISPKFPRFIPI